jgi:transposase-like protein
MFKNLHELIATMPDEKTCREYLAKQRWEDGKAICPHCGSGKVYVIEKGWRYKCGNSECYKKFSVTVGTIFEASNIPLNKWFMAVYLCTAHKKGISSYQLAKDIGVSQKCSWFMLHRIRELMRAKENIKLDNIVEVDEVYIGGKVGNMSKTKRTFLRENGLTLKTKTMVVGMVERAGNLKLITMQKDNSAKVLQPVVKENIDTDAVVITDSLGSYEGLKETFAGHEVVNHSDHEYVRDSVFHTNTIEGAFSQFKRSIYGIYHQISTNI